MGLVKTTPWYDPQIYEFIYQKGQGGTVKPDFSCFIQQEKNPSWIRSLFNNKVVNFGTI